MKQLNQIPPYRLTLLCLAGLVFSALIFSFFGLVPFHGRDILFHVIIIITIGLALNHLLARLFGAESDIESTTITLLILILIFPLRFPSDIFFTLLATVLSVSSKYLLTVEKRHVFNPVAIAAVGASLLYPDRGATWWIGTQAMLPFVILIGLLVVSKLRAWKLVLTFLATFALVSILFALLNDRPAFQSLSQSFGQSALLFFAFLMLTEPKTVPNAKKARLVFALLVAAFHAGVSNIIFGLSFAPELALIFGNIYAFVANSRTRPNNS